MGWSRCVEQYPPEKHGGQQKGEMLNGVNRLVMECCLKKDGHMPEPQRNREKQPRRQRLSHDLPGSVYHVSAIPRSRQRLCLTPWQCPHQRQRKITQHEQRRGSED